MEKGKRASALGWNVDMQTITQFKLLQMEGAAYPFFHFCLFVSVHLTDVSLSFCFTTSLYSCHVLKSKLIVCYSNGKSSATEWHLVTDHTELFIMVTNRRVQSTHSDHVNTKQVKVCYSDKFTILIFAIQIPTVLTHVYLVSGQKCVDSNQIFKF